MKPLKLGMIFVLVFLVSGCVNQGVSEKTVSQGQFVGGDEGLAMNFIDIPQKTLAGDPFDITLSISNRGEENVKAQDIILELSNSKAFNLPNGVRRNEDAIPKTVEYGGIGGQIFVTFKGAKYTGNVLSSESPIPISVEACYPYATYSAVDVCIAQSEQSEVCTPTEVKDVIDSGAPVKISNFEQVLSLLTSGKIRISFIMEVEKVADGNVYSTPVIDSQGTKFTSGASCETKSSAFENQVSIQEIVIGGRSSAYTPGQIKKSCGSNVINLNSEGKGKIQCNFQIEDYVPGSGDYTERMSIKLGYLHAPTVNTNIKIIPNN